MQSEFSAKHLLPEPPVDVDDMIHGIPGCPVLEMSCPGRVFWNFLEYEATAMAKIPVVLAIHARNDRLSSFGDVGSSGDYCKIQHCGTTCETRGSLKSRVETHGKNQRYLKWTECWLVLIF
jgi:hypothetical protein